MKHEMVAIAEGLSDPESAVAFWFMCSCGTDGPLTYRDRVADTHREHAEYAAAGERLHPWVRPGDEVVCVFAGDSRDAPLAVSTDEELVTESGRRYAFRATVAYVGEDRVYFTGSSAKIADVLRVNGRPVHREA